MFDSRNNDIEPPQPQKSLQHNHWCVRHQQQEHAAAITSTRMQSASIRLKYYNFSLNATLVPKDFE